MSKKLVFFLLSFASTLLLTAQNTIPDITLTDLNGKKVSLKELTKDKVVVIDFWATWCVPCINELDAIAEEYEDLQDEFGFELIAVSVDNARSKSRVKPLVNGKDWEYQILLDTNQELKRALNIASVPYMIIVKNGKIVWTHSGYTPGSESKLYETFKKFKE